MPKEISQAQAYAQYAHARAEAAQAQAQAQAHARAKAAQAQAKVRADIQEQAAEASAEAAQEQAKVLVQEQAKVLVQEQAQAAQEKATQYREGMTSEEDILKSLINQKIARITGGILKRSSLIEDILNDLKRDANNPEIDHQEHDLFIIEAANSRIIHEIKEIDSEINHICPKIKVNSTEKDNIINIVWTSLKRGDVQQSMSYIVWAGLRIEVRNRLEKDKFSLKKINLINEEQADQVKKIIKDTINKMKITIIND